MKVGDIIDLVTKAGPGKLAALFNLVKNASVDAVIKVATVIGGGILSAVLYIKHLLSRKTSPTQYEDAELSPFEQMKKSDVEFDENDRLAKDLHLKARATHRFPGFLEAEEVKKLLAKKGKRKLSKEEFRKLNRHFDAYQRFYHVYDDGFSWAQSQFLEGVKPIYIPGKGFVNRLEAWKDFDLAPISPTNNYTFREYVIKNYPKMRKSFGF